MTNRLDGPVLANVPGGQSSKEAANPLISEIEIRTADPCVVKANEEREISSGNRFSLKS
jgi:hypothetical protein